MDCPTCGCELEDDAIFEVLYCWLCRQSYTVGEHGYLVTYGPGQPVSDINVNGELL